MRIESLRYFIVVVNCKSITLAGKILHISQQCVSREIKNLEDELGVKLFFRSKLGVSLTEAGVKAYEAALPILQQIEIFQKMFKLEQSEKKIEMGAYIGLKKNVENVLQIFEGIYSMVNVNEYYFSTEKLEYEQKYGAMDIVLQQVESKDLKNLMKLDTYEHIILAKENVQVLISDQSAIPIPTKFNMEEIKEYAILFYCSSTDETTLYQRIAQRYGDVNIIYKGNNLEKIAELHNRKKSIVLMTESLKKMMISESTSKLVPIVQNIQVDTVLSVRKEIMDLVVIQDLVNCFQDFFLQFD
mgnify:CR=1 FL=1